MEIHNNPKTSVATSAEKEGGIVAEINKEIDDIQSLLNEKLQQTEEKEEIEKNEKFAKEASEIIQGQLTEGEILKKLKDLREKIAFKQTDISKQEEKKAPELTKSEQEAADIVHSAERGVPLFVSNHIKKVAESLSIAILPIDTPDMVIEKFKRRLGYPLPEENKEHSFIPEKTATSPEETKENEKDILIPEPSQETEKEKDEKEQKKVAEIKKQLEKMIDSHKDIPEVPAKKIAPVQIKISNVPKKETDKTISDLILSKLNIPKSIPVKPKITEKPIPSQEIKEQKKETFEEAMKKLTDPYEVENDSTLGNIIKLRLGNNVFFNKLTTREQNFVLDSLNDAVKRSSKEQIQKMGVVKDADHIHKGETLKLEPLFNRNTNAYRLLERVREK